MNTTVNELYADYLDHTKGNEAAAAALTLADVMQRTLDAGKAAPTTRPLTVTEVVKFLRVSPTKVLSWIRSGRLPGYNVAEREDGRPTYRVNPEDLEAFTKMRMPIQPVRKGRPPGRRRIPKVPEWPTLDDETVAKGRAARARRERCS